MLMKKILGIALVFALCLTAAPAYAAGDDTDPFLDIYSGSSAPDPGPKDALAETSGPELSLNAAAVILVERETGQVLYEKNADELRPIASITKVMTMILIMEALERGAITLNDPVVCSEHAYSMGGSQIWMEPGEVFTVDELLRAVAIASANDAAVALAEHVSGGEEIFVSEMNRKAVELGMTNTTFKNSNGLDEDGHLSTARDVAIMSREILRHELIRNYITVWMDELRGGETHLNNTNKLLKSFTGTTGIKTGTTGKAGVCITSSALRDGMELIAVVLGSPDSASRFAAAGDLLEYGFANYELARTNFNPEAITPVKVKLGEMEYCAYSCEVPEYFVVERGKRDSVSYTVDMAETQAAPVEEGQLIGMVTVYSEGLEIGKYPVVATQRIEKLTFGGAFRMLLNALFGLE